MEIVRSRKNLLMKVKSSVAAIASTALVASGILFASASEAQPCGLKSAYYRQQYQQPGWLNTPMAAAITLPGIALAAALYLGGRSYHRT
ncbi:hypothetical protein H6F63_20505 [Trichocoleus sp. FACHB-40]|nr:hypothetical protein [Trichocoleus sp. FACHB-40]